MGWAIEALANVFLELLGDLMAWTVNLITDLTLDIGMDTVKNTDGTMTTTIPEIGTLIDPTAPKSNLIDKMFPSAVSFTDLFLVLGFSILMFLFLTKLAMGLAGPFVKTEKGSVVVIRTFFAAIGTAYSYSIFILFESLFNEVYGKFMSKYTEVTRGASAYALNLDGSGGKEYDAMPNGIFNGKDLIEGYATGQGNGLTVVTIVLFTILLISYVTLVIEIYERYVMLAVLYYASPLAFATLVSSEMDVLRSWAQMVISEIVVMCSNLFFTGVFIAGWRKILTTENHSLFQNPQEFITTMLIMIAWLIVGKQFDQHLKSTSLATAQTGRTLGSAVVAGLGTAATAGRMAVAGVRTAYRGGRDIATGQTSFQRSAAQKKRDSQMAADRQERIAERNKRAYAETPDGKAAKFFDPNNKHPRISRGEASMFASRIMSGADQTFNRLTPEQQGEKIMDIAAGFGRKETEAALRDQTRESLDYVHNGKVSMDKNGLITGETYSGGKFALQVGDANEQSKYISRDYGNGIRVPLTNDQAYEFAQLEASRMPREIEGERVTWSVDAMDQTMLSAHDKEGVFVDSRPVPNMIPGDEFYKKG